MSVITFTHICKSFGKRQILNNVDIALHPGHCYLLTGPNGTGKSTLQRICAGLEKPNKACVDTGHGVLTWKQQRQFLQTHCVYLHQQPYMFDGSVLHNLAYALPRRLPDQERKARIDVALHWAGLESIADCWAKTLSGGERQRVALARGWLRSPRFMLLDEPTNNLDETAKSRTIALLMSLKVQGIALLVASHEAGHFEAIADSWLELQQGNLILKHTESLYPSNVVPLTKTQQA